MQSRLLPLVLSNALTMIIVYIAFYSSRNKLNSIVQTGFISSSICSSLLIPFVFCMCIQMIIESGFVLGVLSFYLLCVLGKYCIQ